MRPHLLALVVASGIYGQQNRRVTVNPIASGIETGAPFDGFVSFSIEFSSFPDYAGNLSHPNQFSENLLNNIGNLQGTKSYIRVGGNTQDFVIYNPDLEVGLRGIINASKTIDYPSVIEIGNKFFESYHTWKDVKFSFGFNLGGNNDSGNFDSVLKLVPLACKALARSKLYYWEYGNEPDQYATSSRGPVRKRDWNESEYVEEWLNGTRAIRGEIKKACPELQGSRYGYFGPSFAGLSTHLRSPRAWADGLNNDSIIKLFASHNYISGSTTLGVTMSGTLLNHTNTKERVNVHAKNVETINPRVPHIWGETNSLFNQGRPNVSNAFGAALWGIDYNLYSAFKNVKRSHMHQGVNYRYQSWQPVATDNITIGTKPPYYGNIVVAAFIGNQRKPVRIAHLELGDGPFSSAYAAYVDGQLRRILVLNLNEYNYTLNGTGPGVNIIPRPSREFSFDVSNGFSRKVGVQRLFANGSDAFTGITWDGWSYNYELDQGRPVRLRNATVGETIAVDNGVVEVAVLDSQAVILNL